MNDFIKTPQLNNKPSIGYLAFITAFLCLGLGLVIGISIYSATISAKLKNFIITTGTVGQIAITVQTHPKKPMLKLPSLKLTERFIRLQIA